MTHIAKSLITNTLVTKTLLSAAAVVTPAMALAHNEHESSNLMAGLLHFFSSPDHLLSVIALVGVGAYMVYRSTKADSE